MGVETHDALAISAHCHVPKRFFKESHLSFCFKALVPRNIAAVWVGGRMFVHLMGEENEGKRRMRT